METLRYNGFEGTAEVDMHRKVCRGKILFISDLVTYEANSPSALEDAFRESVDDYLETCNLVGKNPEKPLRGQFNVRIDPELHRKAVMRGLCDSCSLNEVVSKAIAAYIDGTSVVNNFYHTEVNRIIETEQATSKPANEWSRGRYAETVH